MNINTKERMRTEIAAMVVTGNAMCSHGKDLGNMLVGSDKEIYEKLAPVMLQFCVHTHKALRYLAAMKKLAEEME